MGKEPLVSVIIPVYNGENFILDSYKSVYNQKLPFFEILYIDNNSIDKSVEIIKNLSLKDNNVSLLIEEKQGAGAARNKGIFHANGDYIYFFDVDDLLIDNSLIELKKVLDFNKKIDSVFGNWIQTRDRNIKNIKNPTLETLKIEYHEAPYYGMRWFKNISLLNGTPSFLHRKEVFDKIGLFPESITIGEDATFHIRLGLNCNLAYLDKYIYAYYRHLDSTMSKVNSLYEKVLLHWPQYTKIHIPYFFKNKTPKEYKVILEKWVFVSIAKMLFLLKNKKDRQVLFEKLKKEIAPLKVPFLIDIHLKILVATNSEFLFKLLIYYLIPNYVKFTNK